MSHLFRLFLFAWFFSFCSTWVRDESGGWKNRRGWKIVRLRCLDCARWGESDYILQAISVKNILIGNLINIFIMSNSTRCCCVCIVHSFLRRTSREERIATRRQDNWMVWSVAHRQELRRSLFDHVDVRRWEINRWKFQNDANLILTLSFAGNDVVELLVEHASDFRMCDFLEDGNSGGGNVGGGAPMISQPPPQQQQQHQPPPIINAPQLTLTNPVPSQRKNSDVGLIVGEWKTNLYNFLEVLICY